MPHADDAELAPPASIKTNVLKAFAACFVLPFALNYFVYYGFVTSYTLRVFTESGFRAQYDSGIYKYRILGKELLLLIYHFLQRLHPSPGTHSRLEQFLGADNLNLYHSYFLLNTLFFCLTLWMLFLTLQLGWFPRREREKSLVLVVIACVIALTQFVVTPYDTLAYFLLTLSLYLMLRPQNHATAAALIAVMVLATLTRETAALTISLYATLFLLRKNIKIEVSLPLLIGLAVSFIGVYAALRLHFGWHQGAGNGVTLRDNLHSKHLIGLAFLASLLYLLTDARNALGKRAALLFLALSSPYFVSIVMTGWLFEARLGVPLLIGVVVLSGLAEGTQRLGEE